MPNGAIVWRDLTVPDAEAIKEFYSQVIGWQTKPHPMGGYDDFNVIISDTGETIAGICHARGGNTGIPPQWLMYVEVDDLPQCVERCKELGGAIIHGPRSMGTHNFCVIQDPAGAVIGLIEAVTPAESLPQ